jgi:hypothetical protein
MEHVDGIMPAFVAVADPVDDVIHQIIVSFLQMADGSPGFDRIEVIVFMITIIIRPHDRARACDHHRAHDHQARHFPNVKHETSKELGGLHIADTRQNNIIVSFAGVVKPGG